VDLAKEVLIAARVFAAKSKTRRREREEGGKRVRRGI